VRPGASLRPIVSIAKEARSLELLPRTKERVLRGRLQETWMCVMRERKRDVEVVHHRARIYLLRHLIGRSCYHCCTGDKAIFFFSYRITRSKRDFYPVLTRCQIRLSYLIACCVKWCHRHMCVPERLGARLNNYMRSYDRESIRYQRSRDACSLEVAELSMIQFERTTIYRYRNSWF